MSTQLDREREHSAALGRELEFQKRLLLKCDAELRDMAARHTELVGIVQMAERYLCSQIDLREKYKKDFSEYLTKHGYEHLT